MHLKPLPPQVIAAHKLREQAKAMLLLADELEATARQETQESFRGGVFLFGEVKPRKRRNA